MVARSHQWKQGDHLGGVAEEVQVVPRPPSRAAMRSSNTATVGLDKRP